MKAVGRPGAIDLAIKSPLSSSVLSEASVRAGSAVQAVKTCKHNANDSNAKNLDGPASHWQLSHIDVGEKRSGNACLG